jgi:hypothetical protein
MPPFEVPSEILILLLNCFVHGIINKRFMNADHFHESPLEKHRQFLDKAKNTLF